MDVQSPSTENFSYSRLVSKYWRSIFTSRLQWYRWALGFASALHLTTNVKVYWHYRTHHTPSVLPDFLSFCLSAAARFTWIFLFRDPATFLHFKRPGRAYRWIVCGTVALATVPNSVVHVWALQMALRNNTLVFVGVAMAVLAIIFLIPLVGLVWWMAWTFLLSHDESNEDFEPIVKKNMHLIERGRLDSGPNVAPYTDDLHTPSERQIAANEYLAQAYETQRLTAPELPSSQALNESTDIPQLEEAHSGEAEELEQISDETNTTSLPEVANPPRCRTVARFEYMSQRHSGPHAWFSYPLVPLILSVYATILLIILPIWVHEDRQYKLKPPSPTIKKSLYLPLGMYLLSFYALKHRLRASLFERFDVLPPQPWKKMLSILPSGVGTGGTFRNMETGEITVYDPRRRAFPKHAYYDPVVIRSRKYIAAYNASLGACTTYWGHSGHSVRTEFRFRPTIHRLGFVVLAFCIMWKGFWSILNYTPPNVFEEILKHPKTITREDIAHILRISKIWQALVITDLWFFVLALVFATGCIGSTLVLFFRVVWKYVPQEERDRISREIQEQQQIREGRIRL